MARNVAIKILRGLAIGGAVAILAIVVLTAGTTLMPGTKVRRLFGASPDALAGNEGGGTTMTRSEFDARVPEFGDEQPADAGTDAATRVSAPGEQGR